MCPDDAAVANEGDIRVSAAVVQLRQHAGEGGGVGVPSEVQLCVRHRFTHPAEERTWYLEY